MGDPNPSTNSSNIATNSSNIATNSSNVATNSSNIATQSSQIAAQSSQSAAQSSQIQRNREDIDDLDEFVITPSEAAANPGAPPPGAAQRLRIYVPNVKTCLSMGEPAGVSTAGGTRDGDYGAPSYGGFGVGTDGNIFMTAQGSATLQSVGHIGIHSFGTDGDNKNGSVYIGGNNQIALAAKTGNVIMNGGGGLLLAGGIAWQSAPATEDLPNYSVEVPSWLTSAVATSDAIGKAWTVIDAGMAVLGLAMLKFEDLIQAESSKASKGWGYVGIAANLINIAGNVAGLAGREPLGGTTIHGHSGLIMGTGGTMGIYSLLGTGIASAVGCQMMAPTVAVTGRFDATLESKGGTGVYGKNVQLISQASTLLTSRTGHTAISGESVAIGQRFQEGIQKPTSGVTMNAIYSVTIGTDTDVGAVELAGKTISSRAKDSVSLSGKSAHFGATDYAFIKGGKSVDVAGVDEVTIGGGEGLIKLTKSEASIGFGVPPGIDKTISDLETAITDAKKESDKWNSIFKSAYKKPRNQDKIRLEAAKNKSAADKRAKALNTKLSKLKQKANAIKFKNGGIEIVFQGNKMKIDGSKVESGPIKWMK